VLSRPPNYIQGRGRDGRANGKGIGEREWQRGEGRIGKGEKEGREGKKGESVVLYRN